MIHKLANGPITLTVASIDLADGNFGQQYCITGTDGTVVYISEGAGSRGLARLNLTKETAVGHTLRLEQVKKDGKTFTNIAVMGEGTAVPASAPAPVAKRSFEDNVALYAKCVDAAIETLGAKCENCNIPLDASAIQAGAATLFISSK